MKKTSLLIIGIIYIMPLYAQPLSDVYWNIWPGVVPGEYLIDYGATGTANPLDEPWAFTQEPGYTGGNSPIFSNEDMLWYPGYAASESGLSIEIDSSNGKDDNTTRNIIRGIQIDGWGDTLKTGTADTIYAAFLIKPKAYDFGGMRDIFSFEMSSTGNWSRGRVFMDIHNGGDVQFGVGKGNTPVGIGDTAMRFFNGLNQTYLLVLSYQQNPLEDDVVKLYVNPDAWLDEASQTNVITCYDTTSSDYNDNSILRINIVQRGHTAEMGCIRVAKSWCKVLTECYSNLAPNNLKPDYTIFPNPVSKGLLQIQFSEDSKAENIKIYSVTGILVYSEKIEDRSLLEINTSTILKQGIYFVKINNKSGSHIEQLIIE